MGYWEQNEEGTSFAMADNGQPMLWGDQPADIIDNALWQVRAVFLKDIGRLPTKAEVLAGLQFSRAALDDLPETVDEAEAQVKGLVEFDVDAYEQAYWTATRGNVSTSPEELEATTVVNNVLRRVLTAGP